MVGTDFAQRAQTNIQLYNQLIGLGFGDADLLAVRHSYKLAAELFSGLLRPEGRPFLCHVVGVASILAGLGQPVPVICAGLLHSAYSLGDFGDGPGRGSEPARRALERSLDPQVAAIIDAYARTPWRAETVRHWTRGTESTDGLTETVITIRLADALEDALDFGLEYSRKGNRHLSAIPRDDIVSLAEAHDLSRLAAALWHVHARAGHAEVLGLLREEAAGSVVMAPRSYRPRLALRLPALLRLALGKAPRR